MHGQDVCDRSVQWRVHADLLAQVDDAAG